MKLTRMIQLLIVFLFINSSVKSMHFNDVLASRGQISVSPDWNTSTPSYASPDTSGYSDIDISLMRARGEGIYDPIYMSRRVANEPVQTNVSRIILYTSMCSAMAMLFGLTIYIVMTHGKKPMEIQ